MSCYLVGYMEIKYHFINKPKNFFMTHRHQSFSCLNLKALFLLVLSAVSCDMTASDPRSLYVNIMDYITDPTDDVTASIQRAIDENPNHVIFFPDGIYTVSSPILTPADPAKSVALQLSNYAIIRPADGWNHDEAMIRLGGKDPYNTILIPGSNYFLDGGVLDCRGVAKGVSIDSGRETVIRNTAIKNAVVGIHVKHGANNNSSDADIHDVNITGNMSPESIGILVDGFDNTFSNIRIFQTQTGVLLNARGNILRNVHPLYMLTDDDLLNAGCGFVDRGGSNWYDYCYSDQYSTAFVTEADGSVYHNCFAYWYSPRGNKHVAFKAPDVFNSTVTNFTMGVDRDNAAPENLILEEGNPGKRGTGCIDNLRLSNPGFITSSAHEKYVREISSK